MSFAAQAQIQSDPLPSRFQFFTFGSAGDRVERTYSPQRRIRHETLYPPPPPPLARTLTILAAALLLAAPVGAQTVAVNTLSNTSGTEGDQWHYSYAPGKRIKKMDFSTFTPAKIRRISFMALDSGNLTDQAEQTICLDADAFDLNGNPVENHVCQNEHTIPAYRDPALVSCTTGDFSLDCSSQDPMPDTVRFGIVSIDDNCIGSQGASVTVTFADDTATVVTWTIVDDEAAWASACS